MFQIFRTSESLTLCRQGLLGLLFVRSWLEILFAWRLFVHIDPIFISITKEAPRCSWLSKYVPSKWLLRKSQWLEITIYSFRWKCNRPVHTRIRRLWPHEGSRCSVQIRWRVDPNGIFATKFENYWSEIFWSCFHDQFANGRATSEENQIEAIIMTSSLMTQNFRVISFKTANEPL